MLLLWGRWLECVDGILRVSERGGFLTREPRRLWWRQDWVLVRVCGAGKTAGLVKGTLQDQREEHSPWESVAPARPQPSPCPTRLLETEIDQLEYYICGRESVRSSLSGVTTPDQSRCTRQSGRPNTYFQLSNLCSHGLTLLYLQLTYRRRLVPVV